MFLYRLDDSTNLKVLDMQDADVLFSVIREHADELKVWLPWIEHTKKLEDTKAFIASTMQQFADDNGWQAGIWHNGSLAGVIGFHYMDKTNQAASIGYWLAPSFEKRGLVTKACRALTSYALQERNLHRVEIKAAVGNEKSRAIPERLGFQQEGCLRGAERVNGSYLDIIVYSMLQEEWRWKGNLE